MIVAILADEQLKNEITSKATKDTAEIIWADSLQSLRIIEADAYFDLLFDNDSERIARLKFLSPKPILVSDVLGGKHGFIRVNAWPTMLSRNIVELAYHNQSQVADEMENVFGTLEWRYQFVPDIPGMITPRVVSMIVNEAYYALGENVSTREDIDVAMKLGTNYPYGPFEWSEMIGLEKIVGLLRELNHTDQRYTIAPLLNNL